PCAWLRFRGQCAESFACLPDTGFQEARVIERIRQSFPWLPRIANPIAIVPPDLMTRRNLTTFEARPELRCGSRLGIASTSSTSCEACQKKQTWTRGVPRFQR